MGGAAARMQTGDGDKPVQLPVRATCIAWLLRRTFHLQRVECFTNTYCPTPPKPDTMSKRGNVGTRHLYQE